MATTICENCDNYNCSSPCNICGSTAIVWDEWDDHNDIDNENETE